jgi:ankyrin repeat protein
MGRQFYTQLPRMDTREFVKLLVEMGVDITVKNNDKWTVLHSAARNGHEAVVKLLLEKGVDITAKDNDEWTILHSAAENGHEVLNEACVE